MMVVFYITYAIVILLSLTCPDYIVDKGSPTTEPITLGTLCGLYLIIAGVWWLRHYREHPIIGPIYYVVKMFFIVLFATLFINYAKKSIKDWWKED